MFGYVKTDYPNLYIKDDILYKAMYCGLCKSIGCCCGQKARFSLSYDLTFLSLLLHNVCDIDVKVKKQHCLIHPISKKPMAEKDELSKRIGALNVILTYYKCKDNIMDNNKGRLRYAFFKSSYKKAKKIEPNLNKIVDFYFNDLIKYEKAEGDSIDRAGDYFARLLSDCVKELSESFYTETLGELAYNIGKWVYLIDALDDFDKDVKKGDYNVFINAYKDCKNKKELICKKYSDIQLIFVTILSDIERLSKQIDYKFNHDLIDNILINGMRKQTKNVMEK